MLKMATSDLYSVKLCNFSNYLHFLPVSISFFARHEKRNGMATTGTRLRKDILQDVRRNCLDTPTIVIAESIDLDASKQ